MFASYQWLAKAVARKLRAHLPRHVSVEDLEADALVGLLAASRRFNPALGVPFAPFARKHIRGAILDGLRRADWAGRSLRARCHPVSAPIVFSQLGPRELAHAVAREYPSPVDQADTRHHLLAALPRRTRLAFQLHFLEGLALRSTGQILGITEASASLLISRTIARIKQPRGRRGPRGRHFSPHSVHHR